MRRLLIVSLILAASSSVHGFATYASWQSHTDTVYVNPANATSWLTPQQIEADVQAALNDWNTQGGADFHFTYGGLTSAGQGYDGRTVVTFAPQNSPENYIAFTASWWDSSNILSDSDIILYPNYEYVAEDQPCPMGSGYDVRLRDILDHELGHVAGLNHSEVLDATMHAGYAPCSTTQRTLEADDRAGLQALYGAPVDPGLPPPPPPSSCTSGD